MFFTHARGRGWLFSTACIESAEWEPIQVHWNGFTGYVHRLVHDLDVEKALHSFPATRQLHFDPALKGTIAVRKTVPAPTQHPEYGLCGNLRPGEP